MEIKQVQVKDLINYEFNNKNHPEKQIDVLINSIKEFWFTQPIVVDKDNVIIIGHGRVEAAKRLGLKTVPTFIKTDLNEAQIKKLRILDNRSAELAEYNLENLKLELEELADPELNELFEGFDLDLDGAVGGSGNVDEELEDEVVEAAEAKIVKEGDVIEIGRHKIICGDCTKPEVLKKLMGLEKAKQLITDPPYGVDYSSKNEFLNQYDKGNKNQKEIANDAIEDYYKFFKDFLEAAKGFLEEKNTVYLFISGKEVHNLKNAFVDSGGYASDILVWVKNNHVISRMDYNPKHELVVYGWYGRHDFIWLWEFTTSVIDLAELELKKLDKPQLIKIIKQMASAGTNVIPIDKPLKSDLHPTMKPVRIYENYQKDGSSTGDIILDVFWGSGTNIIAAEKTGRRARVVELDPAYVEVQIKRFLEVTHTDVFKINGIEYSKNIFF